MTTITATPVGPDWLYTVVLTAEGLHVYDVAPISEGLPIVDTGWLGSFPRPSVAASMIVGFIKFEPGGIIAPMTGLTSVVADIYNPLTGTLWNSLTMTETATPGIYRTAYFAIHKYDPSGCYPVTITATKGLLSKATLTGYLIVYVGTPSGISFH